ncbi:MAG: hypothetical protein SFZ24_06660 [Planctomycetota bacterium]|nr:hypothetical protein [Planctomycetota bacterium]
MRQKASGPSTQGWTRACALAAVFAAGAPASVGQNSNPPAEGEKPAPHAPAARPEVQVLPPADIVPNPGDEAMVTKLGWVRGFKYLVPRSCVLEEPSNPMRLVQLRIKPPLDSPEPAGQLTVSGDIGGTVEANIARWAAQFSDYESPPTQQQLFNKAQNLTITEFMGTGTLNSAMPGEPPVFTPGMTMFAAVIEGGPEGTIFVRAVGTKGLMQSRRGTWDMFLRSLRVEAPPARGPTAPTRQQTQPAAPAKDDATPAQKPAEKTP